MGFKPHGRLTTFMRQFLPEKGKYVGELNDKYFRVIEVFEDITYEKVFNRAVELEVRIRDKKREREM